MSAIPLEPPAGLGERPAFDPPGPPLRVVADADQAGALEHLQVLRDGWLAHREWRGELSHRRLACREAGEDGAARRVGQREERRVEWSALCVHSQSVQ